MDTLTKDGVVVCDIFVDPAYIVSTCDEDGAPVWKGPVVLRYGTCVHIDAWLGTGLTHVDLPDVDDATVAALEDAIAREIESWGTPRGYQIPLTREEVMAELASVDAAAEIESERRIAEFLEAA